MLRNGYMCCHCVGCIILLWISVTWSWREFDATVLICFYANLFLQCEMWDVRLRGQQVTWCVYALHTSGDSQRALSLILDSLQVLHLQCQWSVCVCVCVCVCVYVCVWVCVCGGGRVRVKERLSVFTYMYSVQLTILFLFLHCLTVSWCSLVILADSSGVTESLPDLSFISFASISVCFQERTYTQEGGKIHTHGTELWNWLTFSITVILVHKYM